MRLLLDNNLSPRLVELLTRDGWDVTPSASGRPRTRSFSRPLGTTVGCWSAQTLTSGRCSPPPTIRPAAEAARIVNEA